MYEDCSNVYLRYSIAGVHYGAVVGSPTFAGQFCSAKLAQKCVVGWKLNVLRHGCNFGSDIGGANLSWYLKLGPQ